MSEGGEREGEREGGREGGRGRGREGGGEGGREGVREEGGREGGGGGDTGGSYKPPQTFICDVILRLAVFISSSCRLRPTMVSCFSCMFFSNNCKATYKIRRGWSGGVRWGGGGGGGGEWGEVRWGGRGWSLGGVGWGVIFSWYFNPLPTSFSVRTLLTTSSSCSNWDLLLLSVSRFFWVAE